MAEATSQTLAPVASWPAEIIEDTKVSDLDSDVELDLASKDKVTCYINAGINPDVIPDDFILLISVFQVQGHPVAPGESTKSWNVARKYLKIGSRPFGLPKLVVDHSQLQLLPIPGSIMAPWMLPGQRIMRGILWTMMKNIDLLLKLGFRLEDDFKYLQDNFDKACDEIWWATKLPVRLALRYNILDLSELPLLDSATGRFSSVVPGDSKEKRKATPLPKGMVAFATRLTKGSEVLIRFSSQDHFAKVHQDTKHKNDTFEALVDSTTLVETFSFCEFPEDADRSLVRLAAEVFAIMFDTFEPFTENFDLFASRLVEKPALSIFRITEWRKVRAHVFQQVGHIQAFNDAFSGVNFDSILTLRGSVAALEISKWFVEELPGYRRYVKVKPVTFKKDTTRHYVPFGAQLNLPTTMLPFDLSGRDFHVVIDIATGDKRFEVPYARNFSIGTVDGLQEADKLRLFLVTQAESGWTAFECDSGNRLSSIDCKAQGSDGSVTVKVPQAYLSAMRMINVLERRQYEDAVFDDASHDSSLVELMKVTRDFLDHSITISRITGPMDDQEYEAPRATSIDDNEDYLKERFPGIEIGLKPNGLKERPLGFSGKLETRGECDLCYLVSSHPSVNVSHTNRSQRAYDWLMPTSGRRVKPLRRFCAILENGMCDQWEFHGIPATWTEEPDMQRLGFFDDSGFFVLGMKPWGPRIIAWSDFRPFRNSLTPILPFKLRNMKFTKAAMVNPATRILESKLIDGRVYARARYRNGIEDVNFTPVEYFAGWPTLLEQYYATAEGMTKSKPAWLFGERAQSKQSDKKGKAKTNIKTKSKTKGKGKGKAKSAPEESDEEEDDDDDKEGEHDEGENEDDGDEDEDEGDQ